MSGRYIDADELIQWLRNVWDLESEWTNEVTTITALKQTISDIEHQPTADVVEVKRGEWNETTESIGWEEVSCAECSVCGETFVLGDYDMDDIKLEFNYCPNCGAEMRGEK